ncbi:DUF1499 domain-containing protein [Roseibacterium sp. SDUM158017]|uniref:DUF1499 domain-containing protein n=1 Tax=Roseicyclus salinarum TaxID=3036773 RepID=UPI0024152DA3|nr:DUF1499 domain-containing protein [Roseibacterium sp. SDUM158017]MDG4648477.1 DUF1499 domain-containing protein [Roseibacterium sp. SDUM158017]
MRIAILVLAVLAVAVLGAAVLFRLAPMPPERWHADPATATPPGTPNYALRAGDSAARIDSPPTTVAARLAAVAEADGATLIAGDLAQGHATYVARTRLMGFPDAVSIRLSPEGEGTRVEIFSRSRFGQSDLGVNAARVARWIDAATP